MFGQGLVADANPGPRGPPMTADMMNVRDLVEKARDADLLREMVDPCGRRLRPNG